MTILEYCIAIEIMFSGTFYFS